MLIACVAHTKPLPFGGGGGARKTSPPEFIEPPPKLKTTLPYPTLGGPYLG